MDTEIEMTREAIVSAYTAGRREFQNLCLAGIDLSGTDLRESNFSGSDLSGAKFVGSELESVSFEKTNLSHATMTRAHMKGARFGWSNCTGVDFVGADLRQITAQAANFSETLCIRANFNEADCLGAIFTGMNGMAAQFQEANLECADLTAANLSNTDFRAINGPWANFSQSRLNWSNFTLAQLEAADFEGSNLTGATLRAANLSFSNLQNSILQSADAYFSNLSGAKVPLDPQKLANVSSARITYQTYTRSDWQKEDLRAWQNRGATILDFEALPTHVQKYIREGKCNLRISFNVFVQNDEQRALEALIFAIFGRQPSFRILSVLHALPQSIVAFVSERDEDIERFTTALRTHYWRGQLELVKEMYADCCRIHTDRRNESVQPKDVISLLESLSANIDQIQALVSVSPEDQIRRLSEQLEDTEDTSDKKSQVTWSSVYRALSPIKT